VFNIHQLHFQAVSDLAGQILKDVHYVFFHIFSKLSGIFKPDISLGYFFQFKNKEWDKPTLYQYAWFTYTCRRSRHKRLPLANYPQNNFTIPNSRMQERDTPETGKQKRLYFSLKYVGAAEREAAI
jgi:hypothetical protein